MQDEFPLVKEPYKEFAKKLNISEQELLNRLRIYKERGVKFVKWVLYFVM